MIPGSGDGPMTTRRRSRGVLGSWVVGAVFNFEDDSYPMEPTVIRKRCVRTIELHAKAIGITTDGLRGSFRNHEYEQIQGRPGDVATAVRGRGRAAIEVVSDKRARGFTQKRRNAAVCASQHGKPCLRAPTCTIYMYGLILNKEQRHPFVLSQISQIFLRITTPTKRQNPSRYLRGSRPLKGTALRAGPRWLHPS